MTSEYDRYVHEISGDVTRIGSSTDADLVLAAADPLHATVTHDQTDEYILTMYGEGETNARTWIGADAGRAEILRTGAHFTTGPWRLVFARDEYADHGRPYGGRQGGEFAHQRRQPPRPDYTKQHPESDTTVDAAERLDQTGDLTRTLGNAVLIDATVDAPGAGAIDFHLVNEEETGVYDAIVGDHSVGGVTYNLIGDDRIVLLAVSVFPEFRGQGIATDLIRRVLDDVRARKKTITNFCPVVAAFIERNPDYADLINVEHPGVVAGQLGA